MIRRIAPQAGIVTLLVWAALTPGVVSASPRSSGGQLAGNRPGITYVNPGDLSCQGMAYDGSHIVMFGGDQDGVSINKTFIWDGTGWQDAAPALPPCARKSTRMVSVPGGALLYGGTPSASCGVSGSLADTWFWDGLLKTWTPFSCNPSCAPGPLFSEGMAFDSLDSYVVLFGGNTAAYAGGPSVLDEVGTAPAPSNLTFTWTPGSFTDWTPKTLQTKPPCPRTSPTLAWDAARSKVMMFGGDGHGNTQTGCTQTFYQDTWLWNGTTSKWQSCSSMTCGQPSKRMGQRIDWDPDLVQGTVGQVVMFGGNTSSHAADQRDVGD